MVATIGTYSHVLTSHATSWDWWPWMGIAFVLVGVGVVLRRRLNPWIAAAALAFGPVFSTAVHAWGAPTAIAVSILALVTVAIIRPLPR